MPESCPKASSQHYPWWATAFFGFLSGVCLSSCADGQARCFFSYLIYMLGESSCGDFVLIHHCILPEARNHCKLTAVLVRSRLCGRGWFTSNHVLINSPLPIVCCCGGGLDTHFVVLDTYDWATNRNTTPCARHVNNMTEDVQSIASTEPVCACACVENLSDYSYTIGREKKNQDHTGFATMNGS